MAKKRLVLKLSGDVQGIGLRYQAIQQARRLGITGWVQNQTDGSVIIIAEGSEESLNQLKNWCHKGPDWAKIKKIEETWHTATGEFSEFSIK